jgi:hypothetical protein
VEKNAQALRPDYDAAPAAGASSKDADIAPAGDEQDVAVVTKVDEEEGDEEE